MCLVFFGEMWVVAQFYTLKESKGALILSQNVPFPPLLFSTESEQRGLTLPQM